MKTSLIWAKTRKEVEAAKTQAANDKRTASLAAHAASLRSAVPSLSPTRRRLRMVELLIVAAAGHEARGGGGKSAT